MSMSMSKGKYKKILRRKSKGGKSGPGLRGRPRVGDPRASVHIPLSGAEYGRLREAAQSVGKHFATWGRECLLALETDPRMVGYLPFSQGERQLLLEAAAVAGRSYVAWSMDLLVKSARELVPGIGQSDGDRAKFPGEI